jgi:SAM-dependent methyltransferase
MNPEEYRKLEDVEKEHWFYAGKRKIVEYWLRRRGALQPENLLIDCGAGTGRFALEMRAHCRVLAVDDHEESLQIARRHLGEEGIRRGSCLALPFSDREADSITALDVIEHVDADQDAVREMARVLKPGGTLIITVPAFQALWSDWDVALHHYRRYHAGSLRHLLQSAALDVIHLNYINVLAFPAVFALRKFRAVFPGRSSGLRAEERIPPRWLNRALQIGFVRLACQDAVQFPFGVGLLAVAQNPR